MGTCRLYGHNIQDTLVLVRDTYRTAIPLPCNTHRYSRISWLKFLSVGSLRGTKKGRCRPTLHSRHLHQVAVHCIIHAATSTMCHNKVSRILSRTPHTMYDTPLTLRHYREIFTLSQSIPHSVLPNSTSSSYFTVLPVIRAPPSWLVHHMDHPDQVLIGLSKHPILQMVTQYRLHVLNKNLCGTNCVTDGMHYRLRY